MQAEGNIRKMRSKNSIPIDYYLPLNGNEIYMNDLIGKDIQMEFIGEINCIKCGRKTSKSFAQGYCYPCFISVPETEECVLRPELCRAHEGIARDMDYATKNCLIDQVVYLSVTSGIKVGVTRGTQVPTRWIDQGALMAIELARAPNRYTAGLIEIFLKNHMQDKTNWTAMLKNAIQFDGNLIEEKKRAISVLPDTLSVYESKNDTITQLAYPVLDYPVKVKSLNFDKDTIVKGKLIGIKGQYLIFSDNTVINIRKFGGYRIKLNYSP